MRGKMPRLRRMNRGERLRVRCVHRDEIAPAMMCVACERAFDVGENNPIMV